MENYRTLKSIVMKQILLILLTCFSLTSFGQSLIGITSSSQNNISASTGLLTGLVSVWEFNETSGTSVSEPISGFTGTLYGDAHFDGSGYAVFGGAGYMVTETHAGLNLTSAQTVSIWVKYVDVNNYSTLFKSTDAAGYIVNMLINYRGQDNGWVMQALGDGITPAVQAYPEFAAGDLINVCMTYDGTTMTLYVNNIQVGQESVTGSLTSTTPRKIVIGQLLDSDYLNGSINQVAIWNLSLDATKRDILWNSGTPLNHVSW